MAIDVGFHQGPCVVPGFFMDAAQDFSRRGFRAALHFQITPVAILLLGAITKQTVLRRLGLGQAAGGVSVILCHGP